MLKNEKPNIRLIFDRRHVATATKPAPVLLEVYFEGRRKWIDTGVKLKAGQWDAKLMAKNCLESLTINRRLSDILADAKERAEEALSLGGDVIAAVSATPIRRTGKGEGFLKFVIETLEGRTDIRESSRRAQHRIIGTLRDFGELSEFHALTPDNIRKFDDFLHARGYVQPTIHFYHKTLKTYIHAAMARDLVFRDPYIGMKIPRGKSAARKYLDPDELELLETAIIPDASIERVRDLFVFQCYTGLAYVDLARFDFTKTVRRNGKYVIADRRQKTDEDYYLVLLSPAVRILEKYSFRLPVISNVQYNLRLKVAGMYAGIAQPLTSHMGRHTFAVMMLNKGVRMEILAKMLGHADIKTTQLYAKVLNSAVEDAFDKIEKSL